MLLQKHIHQIWKGAEDKGERYFPHEYMYKILLSGELEQYYEIDPKNSWMLAAAVYGWFMFLNEKAKSRKPKPRS